MSRPVPDAIGYLRGRWAIARRLTDAAAGTHGTFTGTGVFTPDGDGLAYEEHGTLDLGHWRGASYRALRYAPAGDGTVAVAFADGRPFHRLDLRTGEDHPAHPCAPDTYDGDVQVVSATEWRQVWRVRGPRKDQTITSTFTRADQAG